MNSTFERELGTIASSISRIKGLYQQWAQKNDMLYGIVQVLYILYLEGPVTQKQISESCETPKQTVNNVIRLFKKEKYITLDTDGTDKRQKRIKLTPAGKNYMQKTLEPYFRLNEKVFARLGSALSHQLVEGLTALGDAIELEMELYEVSSKWEKKAEKEV
ncbi:MAG: MarR family transcriptional regulator [Spirochaetaceae bacterium]|jgi:DNA-binding MarR family transcriptional regulator|nr:MarR family transcriptional regulator [Spirochaetaceae bacterium]